MKLLNKSFIVVLILLLGVGFVSASDDMVSSNDIDVLSVDDVNRGDNFSDVVINGVDDFAAEGDGDILGSVDDDEIIGGGKTHVEVNSYDFANLNPHSIDINDDSDYVAYVYAPNESQGNVSVIIGEDENAMGIFNRDIQSLYRESDGNDTSYSYFYIKPSDIRSFIVPDFYYVTVVYKYGFSLSEANDGVVRFVNDANHVIVSIPPEIVIGDPFNSFIPVFVEGTLGNLRVLIDNKEIINDSVFDLKYDEVEQEFNQFILVDLNDLSIGQHTYTISYYGGNWENVTFSGTIDITYLFDVVFDDNYVYYGDLVNFIVNLPKDASSNKIKVNNEIYNLDLHEGIANLTLYDFDLGENLLNFTYSDEKYGEKSFQLYLTVNPSVYVPSVALYGTEDYILLEFPNDANDKVTIILDNSIIDSVDIVDGRVIYSVDSWQVGLHKVALVYDDGTYFVDKEFDIEIIPNVDFRFIREIGEDNHFNVDIGSTGNITIFFNGQNISTVETVDGKFNFSISSSDMHIGENIVTLKYEGDDLYEDPFYYYDNETGEYLPHQYIFIVQPQNFNFPDAFSEDGTGNITMTLPEGFSGFIAVYVEDELFSNASALEGMNNIPVFGLTTEVNNVSVVVSDDVGNFYKVAKEVFVPKNKPQMDVILPAESTVPTFTINMPSDATGSFIIMIGNYSFERNLENGSLTVTIPDLPDGIYNTTILYVDGDKYSSFIKYVMLTIKTSDLIDSKLKITVSSVYYGKKSVITVKADSSFTGTVNVKIKSKTYAVKVVNGKGTKSISGLKAGTYTAAATFAGNDVFKPGTSSAKFKVKNYVKLTLKKVKVKKSAKNLVITATLKINGKAAKSKNLKFKFNKKLYKAKTNKKGVAKITIKKYTLKKLKVGKKITYSVIYGKKTVQKKVKVIK